MKDWKRHCENLGITEDSPTRVIRRAFRKQALQKHPDKNPGNAHAKEEFQKLHESYSYLLKHAVQDGSPLKPANAAPPPAMEPAAAPKPSPRPTRPLMRWQLFAWPLAGLALVLLLCLDLFQEKEPANTAQPVDPAPAIEVTKEEQALGYCMLSWGEFIEDAGLFGMNACAEHCASEARLKEKEVHCEWKGQLISLPAIAPESLRECAFTIERLPKGERQGVEVQYSNQLTEAECAIKFGRERGAMFSFDKSSCLWNGKLCDENSRRKPAGK